MSQHDEEPRPTVLVVEDDQGVQRLIRKNLERAELLTDAASTGAEAMEKAASGSNALMLLDYQLPDMTGKEVVEKLAGSQRLPPFIMMTGRGDERTAVEMMKLGARDYIVKDSGFIDTLPQTVRRALKEIDGERKLAQVEANLHESEQRLSDIIENANDLIQSVDADGRFVYVNRKWRETLGYSQEEVEELRVQDILREDQVAHCADVLGKVERGELVEKVETVFVSKGGAEIFVEGDVSGRFVEGRFASTRGILRDVTERKRAEEAQRELDRMKSEFISNTSHELRTPLQSIMGFTKLLLKGKVPDAETQTEFLTIIDKQSARLADLINDLLDVSRMESGRFIVQKQCLSLAEVIHDAVQGVGGVAREKGVEIVEEIPQALPDVEADEKRVKQVLINLMGNAVKFTQGGKRITVRAEAGDGEIVISVSDQGIGIPAEAMSHLFERFYQVDGSMTRSSGGSGLGLYISAQIVEVHGGRIWAESEVGTGSTFSFTLPLPPVADQGGEEHGKENTACRR